VKIADKELRAMDDNGKSQRGDMASELLALRAEVRRLRKAVRAASEDFRRSEYVHYESARHAELMSHAKATILQALARRGGRKAK
jgi:hypothetical protein